MPILDTITSPQDLQALQPAELATLAAEIREFLVAEVSRSGGHLGPNLGAVELTIALHRVFESPRDRIVFDTGHQTYVHKILTGRQHRFGSLRRSGGLSGYPSRAESAHDIVENSHASTALSYAAGLGTAYRLRGVADRAVVAVIGDGALTGGMAWEAMNNIAAAKDLPLVVVVNDNGRSYAPTVGGLARNLSLLRVSHECAGEPAPEPSRPPAVNGACRDSRHRDDDDAARGVFGELGLAYIGPVDGHDIAALEAALRQARAVGGPVVVHCITVKGRGHPPAEADGLDCFHAVRASDPASGKPAGPAAPTWTSVFGDAMVELGRQRTDVVAITAAMLEPTGLREFAARYPDRVFDVGIAEQHAVTFATGLALGALHPVVAIYATFANRAFDQILLDAALHRCPVTLVLDRAGVTGDDGPSHHGMWDLSVMQAVPGLRIAAPRDGRRLRELLHEAVAVEDVPTVVRFPKGAVPPDVPTEAVVAGMDVLYRGDDEDVLLVSVGGLAPLCLEVAELLRRQGYGTTVIDPRWVKPCNRAFPMLAARHGLVACVEDNLRTGGVGATLAQAVSDARVATPVRAFGLPPEFLEHGKRDEVLEACGLTAPEVARQIVEELVLHRSAGQLLTQRP